MTGGQSHQCETPKVAEPGGRWVCPVCGTTFAAFKTKGEQSLYWSVYRGR